ncbi:unnamed protein product [Adineta steineri]|uniref:Uncharacterized protein n=1 Tax=Adineta steineri TaxID=433720 RepID=A0A818N2C4_9BILA|nr:unnamed protein product [Adineta steineri]
MKKTLTRSKTYDGDLTKMDRRLTRQTTLASFGHPPEFDYKRDAKHLVKILKQCVTAHILDLDSILHFLSTYNCEQRMLIVQNLEYEYNYNLVDMVLERPESPIRSCVLAMLTEPIELYVRHFHDLLTLKLTGKIDGDITRLLIEILLGLSNMDIEKFQESYKNLFENSIDKDIEIVLGEKNLLSKLIIHLLKGKRYEESGNSPSIAKMIAKNFHDVTSDVTTIDDNTIIDIFTCDSFSQLSTIFDIYEDKYGEPIQEAIQRQFHNQIEIECFDDIIEFTRSPSGYYSKSLRQALEKYPIDYMTLIRFIIGHVDKDLDEIKLEYLKNYDEPLDVTIKTRLDNMEIKRTFILIITKEEDITANIGGPVRFDNSNNSSSIGSGLNRMTTKKTSTTTPPTTPPPSTTASNKSLFGRKISHETFDKFFNVFKTIRTHKAD